MSHCEKGSETCWDCRVVEAIADGATVIAPNNLPIRCMRRDNTLLEHEHGDHVTYRFPVTVKYRGALTANDREFFIASSGKDTLTDDEVREYMSEEHALIYTDGCIALTMYECCYALWHLTNGDKMFSNLHKGNGWYLGEESLQKIHDIAPKDTA